MIANYILVGILVLTSLTMVWALWWSTKISDQDGHSMVRTESSRGQLKKKILFDNPDVHNFLVGLLCFGIFVVITKLLGAFGFLLGILAAQRMYRRLKAGDPKNHKTFRVTK